MRYPSPSRTSVSVEPRRRRPATSAGPALGQIAVAEATVPATGVRPASPGSRSNGCMTDTGPIRRGPAELHHDGRRPPRCVADTARRAPTLVVPAAASSGAIGDRQAGAIAPLSGCLAMMGVQRPRVVGRGETEGRRVAGDGRQGRPSGPSVDRASAPSSPPVSVGEIGPGRLRVAEIDGRDAGACGSTEDDDHARAGAQPAATTHPARPSSRSAVQRQSATSVTPGAPRRRRGRRPAAGPARRRPARWMRRRAGRGARRSAPPRRSRPRRPAGSGRARRPAARTAPGRRSRRRPAAPPRTGAGTRR